MFSHYTKEEHDYCVSKTIVIDSGSGFIKAGFANLDSPSCVMPPIVGNPYNASNAQYMSSNEDYFVGNEINQSKCRWKLKYPIVNGVVEDWNEMTKIWKHIMHYELRLDPSEHPVLLTEPPINPAINREQMCKIMFEEYNVPSMFIQKQAPLSLFANGKVTGTVLDSGAEVTSAVSVYEGYQVYNSIDKI